MAKPRFLNKAYKMAVNEKRDINEYLSKWYTITLFIWNSSTKQIDFSSVQKLKISGFNALEKKQKDWLKKKY